MARALWLLDVLTDAGLTVVQVPGWRTRGGETFEPIGVTWHATAGSGSARAEVDVLLNGSATAPPPIAQLMLYRDGVIYLVGAGRCNHNLTGWDGPNKGLGNTALVGIEMANNNLTDPWPDVQLDAARRATVAIFRRLGTDPMKRLAGHYEHQPAATAPPGQDSTKTDPLGVDMDDERVLVTAMLAGEDVDMPTVDEIWAKQFKEYLDENGNEVRDERTVADILYATHRGVIESRLRDEALLAAVRDKADVKQILKRIDDKAAELTASFASPVDGAPRDPFADPAVDDAQVAAKLRRLLADRPGVLNLLLTP